MGDFSVPLPSPEDLIIMKAVAHRQQDLEDIRGIASCRQDLNIHHSQASHGVRGRARYARPLDGYCRHLTGHEASRTEEISKR